MKQHVQLHHVLLLLLQEKELHSIYVLQEERKEQEGESRIKAFLTVVMGIMLYAQQTDYIKIYVDLRLTAKRERKQFPGM